MLRPSWSLLLLTGCASVVRPFESRPTAVDTAQLPSSGGAVVLEQAIEVRLSGSGMRVVERRRTLITQPSGLDLGRVVIPLQDHDELLWVRARSYPAGAPNAARELPSNAIAYTEAGSTSSMLYTSNRLAVFDIPSAGVGDIIESESEIAVDDPAALPPWTFGGSFPTEVSRYVVEFPRDTKLRYAFAREGSFVDRPPVVESTTSGERWTWTETDLPAYANDPALPPPSQRVPQLWVANAEQYPDWNAVGRWYRELTRSHHPLERSQLPELSARGSDPRPDWFRFVRDHVRYLIYRQERLDGIRPHEPDVVLRSLFGDCKDKATLLIELYRLAGIEAHPVLVRASRNLLFPEQLPTPYAFDHAVVAVVGAKGELTVIDPTDELLAYGAIPRHLSGKSALLVRESSGELIQIPRTAPEQNLERVTWRLKDPRAIELELELHGDASRDLRGMLRTIAKGGLRYELGPRYLSRWSGAVVTAAEETTDEAKIEVHARVESPQLTWGVGGDRLLPMSRFFSSSVAPDGASVKEVTVIFTLPAGEHPQQLPAERAVRSGPFELAIRVEVAGNEIRISRRIRTDGEVLEVPEEIERALIELARSAVVVRSEGVAGS